MGPTRSKVTTSNVASGCDITDEESCRPPRADAVRNRARVLEAAEAVFAAEGIAAPVDAIAEKAGVGVGTVYRHFPTKEKLFEAIIVRRIEEIEREAHRHLHADDPGAAFFSFLEHVVAEAELKRDLIAALMAAGVEMDEESVACKRRLEDAVGHLLAAAQHAGAVRADVTTPVVLSLVSASCMVNTTQHPGVEPMDVLHIVCDGLRPS